MVALRNLSIQARANFICLLCLLGLQMVSPAAAGAPGHMLPSAHPVAKGSGEVEAEADLTLGLGVGLQAEHALTDRLLVGADVAVFAVPILEHVWLIPTSVSARYNLTQGDAFSVAPFMGLGAVTLPFAHDEVSPVDGQAHDYPAELHLFPTAGVAFEGGGERFRLEGALGGGFGTNVLAAQDQQMDITHGFFLVSETGITWWMSEAQSLRLGAIVFSGLQRVTPPLPALSYRRTYHRMFFGAHAGFTPLPSVGISGGVQW